MIWFRLLAGLLLVGCDALSVGGSVEARPTAFSSVAKGGIPWAIPQQIEGWDERADYLEALPPKELAQAMFRANRIVFVGINGLIGNVPTGVDDEDISDYRVVPVDGTSDAFESEEHAEFTHRALQFAESYNVEMLRLLQPRSGASSND